MGLKAMDKNKVREIAGSRGFLVKQTVDIPLLCHGGIDEVDVALKNGIQPPLAINLVFCKDGIEIITTASGEKIQTAIASSDIVSIKFHSGVQGTGSTAGVAASAIVGGALLGPLGAVAGATLGLGATLNRICYAIEYKSKPENGFLLVSFIPTYKKNIDKLFSNAYPNCFNSTIS